MVSLELDVAESMQRRARVQEFVPDADALQALADGIKCKLPDAPRILLLEGDQEPHGLYYSIYDFARPGHVPIRQGENDLVVSFRDRELNELNLTASVARTLVGMRRERQDDRIRRISGRMAMGGIAVGGVGMVGFRNDLVGHIGTGIFITGIAATTYSAIRSDPKIPDVGSYAPPIRLIPEITSATEQL